jgi:hypothetical protein
MRLAAEQVWPARVDQEGQGAVEVGVVEHQLRGLAAEFERDGDEVLRRCRLDQTARGDGPGEGQMLDAGMGRESRARLGPRAGDDVQRTGGQACLHGDGGKGQRSQASFLGRFQDAGIAHGKRRADRTADDLHRIVPRHDMARDSVGFAQGIDGVAVEKGDRLAHDLVSATRVELHVAGEGHRIGTTLSQRFADVERLKPGEVIDAGQDDLADPGQDTAAFRGRHPAPSACAGGMGGGDGGVDIGPLAPCDTGQRCAGRGVG